MSGGDRRALVLLASGLAAGIGLAAFGVAKPRPAGLPAGAVATVNGQPISREALARMSGAVAGDSAQAPVDDARRRELLGRLIDEELLLQRGLELGLARRDPAARQSIVSAVIAAATAGADMEEPSEEDLRRAYAELKDGFRRPLRLRLETALVGGDAQSETQAFRLASRIAERAREGETLAALRDELGARPLAALEGRVVGEAELRDELGAQAARSAAALGPGEVADPLRVEAGWLVLRVAQRSAGEPPDFEQVRFQLRSELLRRARDEAVERVLAELRRRAEIEIADPELRPR